MWLDTETGKRHISPPSTEGGEIVTPIDDRDIPVEDISIEENPAEKTQEAEQETTELQSNDRKRNKRISEDRSDTVERGSDAEAEYANQEK